MDSKPDFTRWASPGPARPEHKAALQDLLDGTGRPPYWQRGETVESGRVAGIIHAIASKVARQFNLNIFLCGGWKGKGNRLLVAQKLQIIDHDLGDSFATNVVRQHFADFICRVGGIPGGLDATEAYPVPYPDFGMEGRPALPPEHPLWEQERSNIVEWLNLLYLWQGASEGLDWDRIKDDINERKYETIDKHRLPLEHVPFEHPDRWDEGMTRAWSRHIRGTMNQFGCVDPERTETAFQFRAIYDEDGNLLSDNVTFLATCAREGAIEYTTPAFMYARRVVRTAPESAAATEDRASDLYPSRFRAMVQEAAAIVPELENLWDTIQAYESKNPPQAAAPSDAELAAWPRAVQRIVRDPQCFPDNYTQWEYPDDFVDLDNEQWGSWDISSFSRWISSNPFFNASTQLQGGGYHGICTGFLALLQYCWNISRIRPRDDAAAATMVQQGRAVYGPQDLYFLSRSALTLGRQINEAISLLPQTAPTLESDRLLRRQSWAPDAWFEVSPDGAEDELPPIQLHRSRRPALNVFEATMEDSTVSTDEDRTTSEESQSDSAHPTATSGQDGDRKSGTGSQPIHHVGADDAMDLDPQDAQEESTQAVAQVPGQTTEPSGIVHTQVLLPTNPAPVTPQRLATAPLHQPGESSIHVSNFPDVSALAESTPHPPLKPPVPSTNHPHDGGDASNQLSQPFNPAIPAHPRPPETASTMHSESDPPPDKPQDTASEMVGMDEGAARLLKHVKAWQGSSTRPGNTSLAGRQLHSSASTPPSAKPAASSSRRKSVVKAAPRDESGDKRPRITRASDREGKKMK
ncbi:hypothetical protein FS749_007924 [Ceratobasidium sp. UAMH 11750]|nr:hypothetical protein FS749_007924 [Ceratobasidium sp. UAMH 11750]